MFCGSPEGASFGHENKGERRASRALVNLDYDSLKHASVIGPQLQNLTGHPKTVACQLCEGRGHTVDIVPREGRRIVLRKRCPACDGAGRIDISRGPVTDPEE